MSDATAPTRNSPSFGVALVNYKTPDLTKACLNLLQHALRGYDAEVWVVDNDSADASTEHLRSLDWIRLIERKASEKEPGFMAHGCALDQVLERIDKDYLFVLHTDTMIYDPDIFQIMLDKCLEQDKVAAVGCLEQVYRGPIRTAWRHASRFIKHYFRRLKLMLGMKTLEPRRYYETYIKSFCALWNIRIARQHGMSFSMEEKNPGYAMQDGLTALGYRIAYIPPKTMFGYLDHIKAGTVAATGGYHQGHRRTRIYHTVLGKLNQH